MCIYDQEVPVLSSKIEFNKLSLNDYILCNREDGHYLKINLDIYNILLLIDGKRNLSIISSLYYEKYGIYLSTNVLFILLYNRLAKYGIFENANCEIVKSRKPSYLFLSFTIINATILAKIVNKLYFLFRKKVAFFVLIFILLLYCIVFATKINLYQSFEVHKYFTYYVFLMWISVTFHEIGHATAASYFGSKPAGIGGGFYLFRPVYYADVTDIWRLSKIQRIIVNLSGVYFELVLNSIFILIALYVNDYMILSLVLAVVVTSLFNFNPLIRSDGFWIISDLINQPNIYYHANKRAIDLILYVFFARKRDWKYVDIILIMYGVLSYIFIGFFLYYVLFENPKSVLLFPLRMYELLCTIFNTGKFSMFELFDNIVPLMFYFLLFKFLKSVVCNVSVKSIYMRLKRSFCN